MHVGIFQIRLRLQDVDSLKAKRGIAKNLMNRIRTRFNLSLSEVDHRDSLDYLGLGAASVSTSPAMIDRIFMKVLEELNRDPRFEVEEYEQTYV